jgi:hypothetical protein
VVAQCQGLQTHTSVTRHSEHRGAVWTDRTDLSTQRDAQQGIHHRKEMPEAMDLGKVHFGSWFWRFQSTISWPCCFGPVARQHILVGTHDGAKSLTS